MASPPTNSLDPDEEGKNETARTGEAWAQGGLDPIRAASEGDPDVILLKVARGGVNEGRRWQVT